MSCKDRTGVKLKSSQREAMVELIQLCVAKFAAEPELMFSYRTGNRILQQPSNIVAARWRGNPGLIEARNAQVRCAKNIRARAQKQP